MKHSRHSFRPATGFSLIEVLIAVVILSLGLLALASLQFGLIRSSAESKSQTMALSLAKAKIEELRSFGTLEEYRLKDNLNEPNFATMGGVTFSRNTTVVRYAYDSASDAYVNPANTTTEAVIGTASCGTTTTGHTCVSGRDFKRAAVTVSWSDAAGGLNTIGIEDVFSGLNPADSAKVSKSAMAGLSPRKAKVRIFNPGNTAGVIPIAIGTGTNTAATNPTPEVSGRGTSSQRVVETRFNVLTYGAVSGATAVATSRVETAIAGCTCTRINSGTVKGYRPTFWDGEKYTVPEQATFVSTGTVATTLAVPQSELCTICCRDHHDNSSSNSSRVATGDAKFDPWRTTHDHYTPTYDVNGDVTLVQTPVGSNYTEACRIIRVDGIFRTAADTFNESMNMLGAKNDGSSTEYVPTNTYRDAYAGTATTTGAVKAYLSGRYSVGDNTHYNGDSPNSTANSVTNGVLSTTALPLHPTSVTSTKSVTEYRWLHSRGLYIDYLEPTAVARIDAAKLACSSCTTAQKLESVLTLLPFTSINLSEVANWVTFDNAATAYNYPSGTGDPPSTDQLYVTMDDFLESLNYVAPVRGMAGIGVKLSGGTQTPRAESQIFRSNSGLALLADPVDLNEVKPAGDVQNFSLSGTASTGGGYFRVEPSGYSYSASTASYPRITSVPSSRCSYNTKGSQRGKYTCISYNLAIPYSSGGTVYPVLKLKIAKYNYQDSSRTSSAALTCTGPDGIATRTYVGPAYPVNWCKNFRVAGASSSASGVTINNFVTTFEGLIGEYSTFDINKIAASNAINSSDLITVSLVPDTTPETMQTPACTYAESTTGTPATTTYTYFVSPTACQ